MLCSYDVGLQSRPPMMSLTITAAVAEFFAVVASFVVHYRPTSYVMY